MDWYFENNGTVATEIRVLIHKLNYYTKLYDEGSPAISDKEWDDLYFELKELEKKTGIIYPNSPTQTINYKVMNKLSKSIHEYQPMLSLDKTKDPDVVQSFVNGHDWLGMFKMDGLTIRLTYKNGILVKAETRGNGEEGEDVTHNALVIRNIPKEIPIKETVIVDGEVISTIDNFEDFANEYKNPRNFAAGSIRLLDSKECASRNLCFVAWDLVAGSNEDYFMYRFEQLDHWGFTVVPCVVDAETVEDAIEVLNNDPNRKIYPIDGYVFKFESVEYGKSLGRTEHHWNNAIAFKFYDEEYETTLKYIDYDVSRTGILTPVAVFEPIEIDGSIVERASLHNMSIMEELLGTPYFGQHIWVIKSNMIIPQITKADKKEVSEILSAGGTLLDNDVICPICGSATKIMTSDSGVKVLYCSNDECEGKLAQRIDHFCGKKGLDIKGFSRKTIEKLIDWGWINGLGDIFKLDKYRVEWVSKAGFGEASVGKILSAITSARTSTSLESFISAIGIPLVGKTIAKEVCKYYETWDDFRNAVGGDWSCLDGFGSEISKAINTFDYTEADEIAGIVTFEQPEVQSEVTLATAIKDKKFCATGKLQNFTRDSLKVDIEANGGKMVNSVTSATDYLITNTPNSGTAKNRDAQKLGVKIITEEEYLKMKSSSS